jgi:hypothetical protein
VHLDGEIAGRHEDEPPRAGRASRAPAAHEQPVNHRQGERLEIIIIAVSVPLLLIVWPL